MIFPKRKKRHGFTVVELVIVIAIIAILSAVLIPTFSSVVKSANRSVDSEAVGDMNEILLIEYSDGKTPADKNEAEEKLTKGGFSIPYKTRTGGSAFFWMPDENRVVLYDLNEGFVVSPENFKEKIRTTGWVNISEDTVKPTEQQTDEEEHTSEEEQQEQEPEEEKLFTLYSGNDFNKAVKNLNGNVKKIVFGRTGDHSEKATGTSKNVSSDGNIKAYLDGDEIYILADGLIIAREDMSGMFSGLGKLTSIDFNNLDTSAATNMSNMFKDCSDLVSLDLGLFNTSKVSKTDSMFNNCENLKEIFVNTRKDSWNMENVSSSYFMFAYCENLPFYESYSILDADFWKFRDKSFAHTGYGGYLSEIILT